MAPGQLDRTNAAHINEAIQYWHPLLKQSGIDPTENLTRLLRGIAVCISARFPGLDSADLAPQQLLQFYQSVNANYGQLFSLPPKSLACIYQKLRCSYSLQPLSSRDGEYAIPNIPALKPDGFVKWSTVQLLLAPSEHALFLQNALSQYEVRDSQSGELFPKLLPRQLFPREPHEEMIRWHQSISDELYREATAAQPSTESKPPRSGKQKQSPPEHETGVSDLMHQAAKFFSNPLSRGLDGRPTLVKHLSRGASYFFGGGAGGGRRHSVHEKPPQQRRDSGTSAEGQEERYRERERAGAQRKTEARSSSEGEEDNESDRDAHTHRRARARKSTQQRASTRRRSHEPPMSPRMYPTDTQHTQPQNPNNRTSFQTKTQAGHVVNEGFVPTHSPPFVATVQAVQTGRSNGGRQSKIKPSAAYLGCFDLPEAGLQVHEARSNEKTRRETRTRNAREMSPSQLREDGSYVSGADEASEEDGEDGIGEGEGRRTRHAPPPPDEACTGQRHDARRQSTPVVGVHGRRYVNEVPWKKA